LLRSDGAATACGTNTIGQCNIPLLAEGLKYTQVAAGLHHSVLLKSDGTVVAIGCNTSGQCTIPAFGEGLTCTHVAAGGSHTLLHMSDGSVVAIGENSAGQCDIPSCKSWLEWLVGGSWTHYVANSVLTRNSITRVLQAFYNGNVAQFWWMSGEAACEFNVDVSDKLSDVMIHLEEVLQLRCNTFDVVFPGGELLSMALIKQSSGANASTFFEMI
jgi:hypothetical protein